MKCSVAVLISFLIFIQIAFAVTNINLLAEPKAADLSAAQIITPNTQLPVGETVFSNQRWDYDYDYWLLGTTWYDYQHNATQGKQIVIGDDGTVHFAWMKGFNSGATVRHVVYSCLDYFPGGSVDNTERSGYCTIDVLNGDAVYANAAVVAFHQQPLDDFITALSPDQGPCWQAFLPFNHPLVEEWGYNDQPMWPHMAIDYNNKAHVLATRPAPNDHYYDATSDFNTWEIPGWQELPSYNNGISAVPVTSEFDTRVALLVHNFIVGAFPLGDLITSQTINDVWVYLSEDGGFSDFNYMNVTDLFDPQTTAHPLPECVWAYCDLDAVFDADGNLHVVYTTRPCWMEVTLIDGEVADDDGWSFRRSEDGQIWHALIDPEGEVVEFSHIAGYVGVNNETPDSLSNYFESDPGAWGSTIDRPSLAIDPANGALYCMFRNFANLPDTSAAGFANADLYVISSCDGGSSWGQSVNVTDSQTPGCAAGDCASEAWGTLAEVVHNGLLHLEFVEDLDAGAIPQEEGSWTDNPVWYMQVPVGAVPCGDAWDLAPRASRLTDSFWDWGELEDGTYEIEDYMRVLNESRTPVTVEYIEVFYSGTQPVIELVGTPPEVIAPYDYYEYTYLWTANIADSEYDTVVRINTTGGSCDFTLSNRLDLDLDTAESFLLWGEAVPAVGAAPRGCPNGMMLSQNYPNPFNPTTTIEFALPYPQEIQLAVYNILGERVAMLADGMYAAGMHRVTFDAFVGASLVGAHTHHFLPSGVYFYRLSTGDGVMTRKMVLVR